MNRDDALVLLRGGADGVKKWNTHRREGGEVPSFGAVQLAGLDLQGADLQGIDLQGAHLSGANLAWTDLQQADLSCADLAGADLHRSDLVGAQLVGADLTRALLLGADLTWAKLTGAKLQKAGLSEAKLHRAVLVGADLGQALLGGANLSGADLAGAILKGADLNKANLQGAELLGADLHGARLGGANLSGADLSGADLRRANLRGADLHGAQLVETNLSGAECFETAFIKLDLTRVVGLEEINHSGPSTIGLDTILLSGGHLPESFLRGCGLQQWEALSARLYNFELTPPGFEEHLYKIFDAWTQGKGMINGCFISYSWKDTKFATKLREGLMDRGFTVWLDKHNAVAGVLQDQIWRAIQHHNVVILVLSEDSIKSDWVENELDMARRKEKDENRAVLCPVALDDTWKAKVDASVGPGDPSRALWRTLTSKLVLDFSAWKTKAFGETFDKLARGLQVNYWPRNPPAS